MKLKEFVEKFICKNSLIRLWCPIENGHQLIYKNKIDLEFKKIDEQSVCMEHELIDSKTWQSKYNNCEVIGVKDIVIDGFYREAINIVIDKINIRG